ncbi:MAG: hypothetical protein IJR96_06400 [Pseudobutyrivibrio sp.]|nr:hypothetical protein [Pseudobutyrivibrio sp.]
MVSKDEHKATINAYINKKSKTSTKQIIDRCDVKISLADPEGMGDAGGDNVVEIPLKSSNLDDLKKASKEVEDMASKTPGVLSVQNTLLQGGFKAQVTVNPEMAMVYGFTPNQIGEFISQQISGKKSHGYYSR